MSEIMYQTLFPNNVSNIKIIRNVESMVKTMKQCSPVAKYRPIVSYVNIL